MSGGARNLFLAVLLQLIAAAGCFGANGNAVPSGDEKVTQWKGQYGAFKDRGVMVFRNREGARLPPIFSQLTAQSRVDFSRDMIIAIFLGQKRTGGYGINIVKAEESDGMELLELPGTGIWDPGIDEVRKLDSVIYRRKKVFVIEYEEISPGPGSIVTQALTTPYEFKIVRKSDLPVVFVRYEKVKQ